MQAPRMRVGQPPIQGAGTGPSWGVYAGSRRPVDPRLLPPEPITSSSPTATSHKPAMVSAAPTPASGSATPAPTDALGTPAALAGSAMAGLQAAGPTPEPGLGFTQKSGAGALNPKLGQRIPPDIFSGLRALTY